MVRHLEHKKCSLNKLLNVRKIKATFLMLVSMQYCTFCTENVGSVCKEETNKNKNCQDNASDSGGILKVS